MPSVRAKQQADQYCRSDARRSMDVPPSGCGWHRASATCLPHAAQLLAVILLGSGGAAANGQQIRVDVPDPPYYVGEPTIVEILVGGFDEAPEPACEITTDSPEVRAEVVAVSPKISVSQRLAIDPATGQRRVEQTRSVVHVIECRVTASSAGDYRVGPFVVTQAGKSVRADGQTFAFQDIPLDPEMRVRLVLPDAPVYPGQRVPVRVEWWYAGDLESVDDLRIRSPMFDRYRFAPDPRPSRQSNVLPIETPDGRIGLVAQVRRETDGPRTFRVFTAERTWIPDRPGDVTLEPITASIRKITAWERVRSPLDDFGFGGSPFGDLLGDRRRPKRVERRRSVGEPLALRVKPFPATGRPESFAGAVGSG